MARQNGKTLEQARKEAAVAGSSYMKDIAGLKAEQAKTSPEGSDEMAIMRGSPEYKEAFKKRASELRHGQGGDGAQLQWGLGTPVVAGYARHLINQEEEPRTYSNSMRDSSPSGIDAGVLGITEAEEAHKQAQDRAAHKELKK